MRKEISIALLLLVSGVCVAQPISVDSMKTLLRLESDSQEIVRLKCYIGEYDQITRVTYWDSLIGDAKSLDYGFGIVYSSFMQSLNFSKNGNIQRAIHHCEEALEMTKETKDSIWMGYCIEYLGHLNELMGESEASLNYFNEALNLYNTRKDSWRIGHVSIRIGQKHQQAKEYERAKELYEKALRLFQQNNDTSGLTIAYDNLGKLNREKGNLDTALTYFLRSIEVRGEFQDQYYLPLSLIDLGSTYIMLGQYEKGISYLKDCEVEFKRIGDSGSEAMQENYYWQSEYYRKIGNYKEALSYKEKSISIRDSIHNENNTKATLRQQTKYEFEKAQLIKKQEEQEAARVIAEATSRRNNLQYSVIFLGILIVFGLTLSLGFINVSQTVAEGLIFFAFLILFEFLLVLGDPYVESITGGEPIYKLLANALLAGLIFPAHAFFERALKRRLVK